MQDLNLDHPELQKQCSISMEVDLDDMENIEEDKWTYPCRLALF
jgi:hypothetical protein